MIAKRSLLPFVVLAFAAVLSGCVQKNTGDEPAPSNSPSGLNRFLMFPNPIAQNTGGFETNTTVYADAYYRAIDTDSAHPRDTLEHWKSANGFGSGTGTELRAVFRDVKDLGYGRNMNGRLNADGSVAFYVENYNVGYTSTLNVDVAVVRDKTWHVGTNAIEWSASPCVPGVDPADCNTNTTSGNTNNARFAKFYNFSSVDGTRQFAVDLDGRGLKAMPGPCITCHGGRGDPLTPPDASTNKPRFPLVENSLSRKRGDVQARLQGMNVDSFQFSTQAAWTRAMQEPTLKTFNQWILCTYPLPAGSPSDPTVDACRVAAGANEWQGTAAAMIKSWYGGTGTNGMPSPMFADSYIPSGTSEWNTGATITGTIPSLTDQMLYRDVVAPYCRTCHILRGTKNQNDIDFMTLGKFQSYGDRIKAHVFDRGTMPLALIVYNDFWNSSAPDTLASFVDSVLGPGKATTSNGTALKPGRPIANPGPNRMVSSGFPATLSAEDSLFATTFHWSSSAVAIKDADSMIATFPASPAGTYTVTLTVGNGTATDVKDVVITSSDSFPDPATLRFVRIQTLLQTVSTCTNCHTAAGPAPIAYTNFDRNGIGGFEATDDAWFYKELIGRVNFTEMGASPLLLKPSGKGSAPTINKHHAGGNLLFDLDTTPGLSNFSIVYNWILAGAPSGGIAANAGADSANSVTFAGFFPATNTVALDGSASKGVTNYAWSVVSPTPTATHPNGTPATGTPASITQPDPTLPGATLNVFDVGTYTVRLTASNTSDPAQTDDRTITVSETPLNFNVSVVGLSGGTVAVPFNGNPSSTITVNVTQNAGNPILGASSCVWTVTPASPKSGCAIAILNVTTNAVSGTQRKVTLTQQNLSLPPVAVDSPLFTISAAAGSAPSGVGFTFPASSIKFTVGNNVANTPSPIINNVATNSITLTGSAAGPGTLNYSWTAAAGTAGCAIAPGSSTSPTKSLTVTKAGTCNVTLTVSNGISTSTTQTVTVTSAVQFSAIASLLTSAGCTGCHTGAGNTPAWDNNAGLFARITGTTGVVNTTTPKSSLLLVCPQAGCTATNTNTNTSQTMSGGQSTFVNGVAGNLTGYDSVLSWIMNGATNP